MKTIADIINENKQKVVLTDVDKIICQYIIRGVQCEKNKMKAIDDLSAMISSKVRFGDSDKYTMRDVLCAYLDQECDDIPELLGGEDAAVLYNYIMDVSCENNK